MKRSIWVRLIAVILIVSMLAAPVSAAANRGNEAVRTNGLIGYIIGVIKDIIEDIFDDWFDKPGDEEPVPTTPTDPIETTPPTDPAEPEPSEPAVTDPTVPSEPEQTDPTDPSEPEEEAPEYELNLVEGHANTENGHLLRAVTYTLTEQLLNQPEPQAAPYALRTGVSTLSRDTKTAIAPMALGSAIEPMAETVTTVSDTALEITSDDLGAVIPDGKYVIYFNDASKGSYMTNNTKSGSPWGTIVLLGTIDKSAATYFTFTRQSDGTYAIQGPAGNYMNIERNKGNIITEANYFSVEIKDDGIWLRDTNSSECINALDYVNQYPKGNYYFGGWTEGSPLELYAVTTETVNPEEPEQPESDAKLIYFPVTMFNYDQDTINGFTDKMDDDLTVREGFYFSNGGTELNATTSEETSLKSFVDGKYVLQNYIAKDTGIASWLAYVLDVSDGKQIRSYDQDAATVWTLTNLDNGNVTLTTVDGNTTYYLTFGSETSAVTTEYTELKLVSYPHTTAGVQITKDGYYLGHSSENTYCGNTNADSTSNGIGFFPVADDGTISSSATEVTTVKTVVSGYERWNWWSYLSGGNSAQNKFYAGLVEDELNENNEIVFTVNEPGIFTYDASAPSVTNDGKKDIYQHVGLPFVKNEYGYYTFDSDDHGTYFADTTGDGASDPGYGAPDDYFNMFFDYQNTQGWADKSDPNSNLGYGDKSKNLWAPYNTNENDTGAGAIDYHFGMRADIPFSMTANGKLKERDDNSDDITFTFAGDDDVWIFIDGHLVIDLGGIHNRIGATINFADNTITYFRPESNAQTLEIGSFNTPDQYPLNEDGTITVKLYDDASGAGALGQTRGDFAAEEAHVMSIFYLERGEGTSNCKIEFNLPMRDTLLITKDASKSWSEKQDERDGENGDGTANLTAREQAAVNNIPFGFTLYKKTADAATFTPVANTSYFVQDQEGNIDTVPSYTDSNGHFTLFNGQSAKFMTDFPSEGVTYYVVEDAAPDGFLTPDYLYGGVSTGGMDWYDSTEENPTVTHVGKGNEIPEHELPMNATENKSYVITAYGSIEAIDSLEFTAVNYLNADLPNPTALAFEDIIVIDYGLPVHIDPMANDIYRGDSMEIVAWGDESLTLNEVPDEYGNAVPHDADVQDKTSWSGTQNFHSGTVTFLDDAESIAKYGRQTFRYELNKQLTEVEVISYIIKVTSTIDNIINGEDVGDKTACRYALAKVYIVPATIMYYEENFNNLVSYYTDAGEKVGQQGTEDGDYQEPGVVGKGYSTYGSDLAYLKDSGDSNGTSYKLDTTNGYVRFLYSFTGTGTSFFARTSADTGYFQALLFEGALTYNEARAQADVGAQIDTYYRDTYYEDTNGIAGDDGKTLYNIPVYTQRNLPYGTYTVLVTVAKEGTPGAGGENGSRDEFYLDGIRVMQPLKGIYFEGTHDMIEPENYDPLTVKAVEAYDTDNESNLEVVTLREKLIDEFTPDYDEDGGEEEPDWPFVVLTDTNGSLIKASEYESIGPKEEVYLAPGQKVRFSLKYWEPEGLHLYMGMKAPFGPIDSTNPDRGSASLLVGNRSMTLYNATDCYYDVTNNYASLVTKNDEQAFDENGWLLYQDSNGNVVTEIYNDDGSVSYTYEDGTICTEENLTPMMREYYVVTYTFEATDSIVSLTNIKVVGNFVFTILENTDIDIPGDIIVDEGEIDEEGNE